MTNSEFQEIVSLGQEGMSTEFKTAHPWAGDEFKSKIAKSILGFSNVRDGGRIIIGAAELEDNTYKFIGMEDADIKTWCYDDVAAFVSNYADPFVNFSIEQVPFDGKIFVVVTISEFSELPVVCKQNGKANLRKGAIYTRTRRIPETAEVPSQTEMREILDLAAVKLARKFLHTASDIGIHVPSGPTDSDKFQAQLGEFA